MTYVLRQFVTRHNIIMARHGWNRNLNERVARPVATSCPTCRDGRYGQTNPGILCTHFVQINYILSRPVVAAGTAGQLQAVPNTPCRDNHIMLYLCRATASPARYEVCLAVSRTSRMSCTVVSKCINPWHEGLNSDCLLFPYLSYSISVCCFRMI